jgi:hypothetical protein
VRGVGLLAGQFYSMERDLTALIEDEEPAIRRAALGTIDVPIGEKELPLVAGAAADTDDRLTAAQAAALLCENALAHGVDRPSADLMKLLAALLSDGEVPAESVGPVVTCCYRFEAAARAELIDIARTHPDPAVGELCDALDKR